MTAALHLGTVSRLDAAGRPYVVVARRSGRHEYGPCPFVTGPWRQTTQPAGDPPHAHAGGPALAKGDRVLVGFATGITGDTAVVLGRLA